MTRVTNDEVIQASIAKSTEELAKAKDAVHELANELINVVDVIEPALADQVKRLREARMSSVSEIKQMTEALKELRGLLLSPDVDRIMDRGERLLSMLRELESFRSCGALEAFAHAFSSAAV